ncbi:unnamed protein product [Euphydryas editha]|uniref:Uncharacterized protein n=1 Tax=Euphydryas editha TaxID=104508 RepID=A0AAU9TN08_EUPED|nr:unnamed protein product [Euphydryas editha]
MLNDIFLPVTMAKYLPCNGVGGTLKLAAATASLQLPFDKQILKPQELYQWAMQPDNLPKIGVSYSTTADDEKATEILKYVLFES